MIILDSSHDHFHSIDLPGAYEWSYFDGLSDDGKHGFTAIWFRGVPMSPWYSGAIEKNLPESLPTNYTAFAFHLYQNGKRIGAALVEGDEHLFEGSRTTSDAAFGDNLLRSERHSSGLIAYRMKIDQRIPLSFSRMVGEIDLNFSPCKAPGITGELNPERDSHYWVPVGVDGEFSASVNLVRPGRRPLYIRCKGKAYHDRNFGYEPLQHIDVDWYWGRLHINGMTLIFFLIQPRNGDARHTFTRAFLFEKNQLVRTAENIEYSVETSRHWATLPLPSRLTLGNNELQAVATTHAPLESGPFYHRIIADIEFTWDGRKEKGKGVVEYLRPSRLRRRIFHPFIKFRAIRVT